MEIVFRSDSKLVVRQHQDGWRPLVFVFFVAGCFYFIGQLTHIQSGFDIRHGLYWLAAGGLTLVVGPYPFNKTTIFELNKAQGEMICKRNWWFSRRKEIYSLDDIKQVRVSEEKNESGTFYGIYFILPGKRIDFMEREFLSKIPEEDCVQAATEIADFLNLEKA